MVRLATVGAAAWVLWACGPVQSTSFLMDAEIQLQAARTAEAPKYAPYEWTSANLYLHKAREEVGYSSYESAVEYARKAKKFATEARDKAVSSPERNEPGSVSPKSQTAPSTPR